ncbi:MAG TPA: hydrogenase formation protein HypD [Deltaproteobacteria bacterium]|nr:hydrogenase formation protein HypD [Deltaproteobacteria bacterium]
MRLKYIDDFRDPATAKALVERIRGDAGNAPVRLMEVCGTHTVAIARSGIRPLLSGAVTMLSGPGCPVCVTPDGYIDAAISLGRDRRVLLASFGDMLRVPGRSSSLEKEKGNALEVRIVYSPLDAVTLAAATPDREVVFLGVGFETTAPAIGGAIKTAAVRRVGNFSVLPSLRTIPGAMEVLASDPDVRIEGFLCPAHVSVVIGTDAYRPIAETYGIPCVVAGFEPLDILLGISMLLRQKKEGVARVENEYSRVAQAAGNRKAQEVIREVFVPCDTGWRGIGVIPGSGLRIAEAYAAFDAEKKFGVPVVFAQEKTACRCGDVLKGKILPDDCPLFGKACVPEEPYGPCMVSGEGTCAAYYKYGAA